MKSARIRIRHELMKKEYPDKSNAKGIPYTGLSNTHPETKAIAEQVKRNMENMQFDMPLYRIRYPMGYLGWQLGPINTPLQVITGRGP